ncbi:aquaporin [Tricladium varicosporioides]|nr:aquaporin [Hymenoscyphus varicosporioides]
MTPTGRIDAGNAPAVGWRAGTKNTIRNHFIVMMGEFCGTFMFLFFAFAPTQQAVTAMKADANPDDTVQVPDVTALLYIASAFGCSLAANVWAFYRINGGMLNPAVTLGLCLSGAVPWIRGLLVFPCQILGGIAAAGVVSALFPGPLLVGVSLGNDTSIVQGLFIEMFITMQLVIVVLLLAAEKHRARALAPLGIGLSLFIAHLAAVYYTGSGVNPARAFGPDVINASFPGYHWIYWLGPFMGAAVAAGFYKMFKLLGYETANPGQDHGDEQIGLLYPDEEAALAGGNENVNLLQFHPKQLSTTSNSHSPMSPRGRFFQSEKANGGPNGQPSQADQTFVTVQENATADTPPGSSQGNPITT